MNHFLARHRRFRAKTGVTLLEVLIVATIGSGFVVLAGVWMHQTFKFSTSIKLRQQSHMTMTRLAWDLRDCVRQAKLIDMDGDSALHIEHENGKVITFQIFEEDPGKLRIEKSVSTVIGNGQQTTTQETFALGPRLNVKWDDSEMPNWINLIITRSIQPKFKKSDESESEPSPPIGREIVELHVRSGIDPWPGGWIESNPVSQSQKGAEK